MLLGDMVAMYVTMMIVFTAPAGQLVTALWVVIPRLTFANSCLATVFYAVGMVMVAQNAHIGSRLKAMVVIPGAWTVGSICGGITVSFVPFSP